MYDNSSDEIKEQLHDEYTGYTTKLEEVVDLYNNSVTTNITIQDIQQKLDETKQIIDKINEAKRNFTSALLLAKLRKRLVDNQNKEKLEKTRKDEELEKTLEDKKYKLLKSILTQENRGQVLEAFLNLAGNRRLHEQIFDVSMDHLPGIREHLKTINPLGQSFSGKDGLNVLGEYLKENNLISFYDTDGINNTLTIKEFNDFLDQYDRLGYDRDDLAKYIDETYGEKDGTEAVSYTHLTLPTILLL